MALKLKIGDKVTVKEPQEAYGSDYGLNPKVVIQPGELGTVAAVDVPYVTRRGTFLCVDFEKPGVFQGAPEHNNVTWRIGVSAKGLKRA